MPATQTITILKEIRKKLKSQELSVLVGAGFSKNVNDKLFPSWWQLLKDMALDLHRAQFEEDFKSSGKPKSSYTKYIEDRAYRFIDLVGPLKVASLYLDKQGYRESLDWHIERNTPYVDENRSLCYYENGKQKRLPLTNKKLEVHEKLVNIPWNNIYTTNYDNLLESCIDRNIEKHLGDQIAAQTKILKSLQDEVENAIKREIENNIKLEELTNKREQLLIEIKAGVKSEEDLKAIDEDIHTIRLTLSQIEGEKVWKEKEINRKDDQKTKIEQRLRECSTLITNSAQLALKKNRNIIKLHGSIRQSEDEPFGFDNDARKQYIITQEDFDTYPQKHEAFTQLMRISLLQESFCLIGFSGVDPNFLAWIGWVRDILFKSRENGNGQTNKIYLIDLSGKPVESNKISFYKNHQIAFVPLATKDSIDYMEGELHSKIKDRKSKTEILSLFFDYLNTSSFVTSPRAAVEADKQIKFYDLCSGLRTHTTGVENVALLHSEVETVLHQITEVAKENRLPSPSFSPDHSRYFFLRYQHLYIDIIQNETQGLALAAIHQLIKAQYYSHSILFYDLPDAFEKLLKVAKKSSPQMFGRFLLLDLKDSTWQGDDIRAQKLIGKIKQLKQKDLEQEFFYRRAIHEALNFRFRNLKLILDQWEPTEYWNINKSGLLSLFDQQAALLLLNAPQKSLQDHLYGIELTDNLRHHADTRRTDHGDEIKKLKEQGLSTLRSKVDGLIQEFNKSEKKITPYGNGKFSTTTGFSLSNTNDYLQSVQVLGILDESGFQSTYSETTLVSSADMYEIAVRSVKIAPFVALFYVLQCWESKVVKRIAQDFAYEDNLSASDLNRICKNLTTAYFDKNTPKKFKDNIAIFLSEFIISVDPTIWEPFLAKFWKEQLDNKHVFNPRVYQDNEFVDKALNYVQDAKLIALIITDCLTAIEDDSEAVFNTAIQYLYCIANNPVSDIKVKEIRRLMRKSFSGIISKVPTNNLLVFALGNLSKILTKEEEKSLVKQVARIDFSKINNVRLWRILLYYIDNKTVNNRPLINEFKKAIISSPGLWNAGFTKDGAVSSRGEYIQLRMLSKNKHINAIEWTKDEAFVIYNRMLQTFEQIEEWTKKPERSELKLFTAILEEMVVFLKSENNLLKTIPSYNANKVRIEKRYQTQREFEQMMGGLVSNEEDKVFNGLSELMEQLYSLDCKFEDYDIYITTVLNKILLQSQPRLVECIQYISKLFHYNREHTYFKKFSTHLQEILSQYHKQMPEEMDKADIEEQLVRIAYILKLWKVKNKTVSHFVNLLENSRYNNVRYNLRYQLDTKDKKA